MERDRQTRISVNKKIINIIYEQHEKYFKNFTIPGSEIAITELVAKLKQTENGLLITRILT